ncbi:MAG: hypothetical protein K2H39_00515 [Paramuribaculum sp.]|nr:hypothetical protein [Paramuribaculum sp.]
MDRRKFLKLSVAAGLLTLLPDKLKGAALNSAHPRCRVSVVRRNCFDDLQSCFLDDPEAGGCTMFSDDFSEILNLGGEMPRNLENRFCQKAWNALCEAASESSGCSTASKATLASCGDPTRPVIFKIEYL